MIMAATMDPKPKQLQKNIILNFRNLKVKRTKQIISETEDPLCLIQGLASKVFFKFILFMMWSNIFSGWGRWEKLYVLEWPQRQKVCTMNDVFSLTDNGLCTFKLRFSISIKGIQANQSRLSYSKLDNSYPKLMYCIPKCCFFSD